MAVQIKFEKVVPEGKALGFLDGKAIFAVGPLPGESAELNLTRQKRGWAEGIVAQILSPSPHRSQTAEAHYLACSPWQGVDYSYQIELKRSMLAESFEQHRLEVNIDDYLESGKQFGYRNKLEFTLQQRGDQAGLAFHERGSWRRLVALPEGCRLGSPEMNSAALEIAARLGTLGRLSDTLTVRQSRFDGRVIAILALLEETEFDWSGLVPDGLAGLVVWLPPRHGRPGQVIWKHGQDHLTEEIGGVTMSYPFDSFFQVNIPMFELALSRIAEAAKGSQRIVELYSGAGTIGLPLAKAGSEVTGVEIVASSVELAGRNAKLNGLTNYEAILSPSEKIDPSLLDGADCVILDPPRAGLHQRVVESLRDSQPRRIIYLSCNPVTQARDAALLADLYRLSPVTGFDFYPGTLHLESLLILDKK